ncbi:MAG: CBS domain-containing protein [Candidatus Aenigmatarchaeota archaeon]
MSKYIKKLKKKKNSHILHEVVKTEIERNYIDIETPIKNIMSTNLKIVEVGQNLREVIELLGDFEITGVPVRSGNKIVGVVSDTDIMKVMQEKNLLDPKKDVVDLEGLEKIKVEEIMSKPPITVYQNDKITDASDIMIKHKVDRLIVVDENNKTVGIVTREDVVKGLTSEFFLKSIKKSGENTINSNVDLLLTIVRKKNMVSIRDLSKEMKMNIKDLEDLIKILENKGLIEIVYPLLGYPKIKVVKK